MILNTFGSLLGSLWRPLGAIFGYFWVYWGPWGSILWVWGYPWEPSARNRLQRPMVSFTAPPLWTIFEPKGSRKGSQKGSKFVKNPCKIQSKKSLIFERFWDGFWLMFGRFLGGWSFKSERLVQARCYFAEIYNFSTSYLLGAIFNHFDKC